MNHPSFKAQLPTILTVPGLDGSGPDHWQSHWEHALPDCRRVDMRDWSQPDRAAWIERIDEAIHSGPGPVVLVAHSLGCLAVAWWTRLRWTAGARHKLLGAMLVAPPCADESAYGRLAPFHPLPRDRLPFPSIVVASRNDPYASFADSAELAEAWGSQLVDAGEAGHLNAQAGLGLWERGVGLLESLLASVSDARRTARARLSARRPWQERRFGSVNDEAPVTLNWSRFLGRRRSDAMSDDEMSYFKDRATAEIALAERARHPDAARSHSLLAGYYLDLVHCGTPTPDR